MAQCPNCHSEVKADERFCGNCGSRIEPSAPPPPTAAPPTNSPPRTTGKETVVLPKITDLGMQPPAPPTTDATIVAAPAPAYQPPVTPTPTYQPPVAPTIIGGTPPDPTSPYSGGAEIPPIYAMPPAAKSGGNVWKILAIIAGIGIVACIALSVGAYLVIRRAGTIAENTLATTGAGLSSGAFATIGVGLETAAALPSIEPFATTEADATAAPDATRTPKPAANTGAGATLYSDNFDSQQSSDFTAETNDSASYKFVDGAYLITVTKPKLLSWATMKGDYGDASISVDASIDGPTASAAGLIFHYQDDKNFYIYSIDGEGRYELDVYKNDKPITLIEWTESSAIKPVGELNTLRVETSADTIRLYVNDRLLDEVSDSTIANGKAALVVNTFDDPNVTVKFDNLIVRGIK